MKLLTIKKHERYSLGVQIEGGIIDIEEAIAFQPPVERVAVTISQLIEGGETALIELRRYVEQLERNKLLHQIDTISFGPCVLEPQKIICVGLNYRKHAEETNADIPKYPILFNKFSNALTGHGQPIQIPDETEQLDYEAELAIVIGKEANHVSREDALDYVFGYACANDLSARDLQLRTAQWMLGKTCDDFCPLGPYVVTSDEVEDPNNLRIQCTVNGEIRQDSNTSDMIFYCDEIISYISKHMTLKPGDIILTGTPEGVILGYPSEKRCYLKSGDIVTIEIEKLGSLSNEII